MNAAHRGIVVGALGELDDDLTASIGCDVVVNLINGPVGTAGRGVNVEIRRFGRSIDRIVELPFIGAGPVGLGEFQGDLVG